MRHKKPTGVKFSQPGAHGGVFHLGESGGNYFYAMEFVDGQTLEALIRRRGGLETELALEIVTQVAAGLTAIHKQHLVHRDIKPSNIMLSWEADRLESVKIIDQGLAKRVTEDALSIAQESRKAIRDGS
jgi:serine/threonine protein kinase